MVKVDGLGPNRGQIKRPRNNHGDHLPGYPTREPQGALYGDFVIHDMRVVERERPCDSANENGSAAERKGSDRNDRSIGRGTSAHCIEYHANCRAVEARLICSDWHDSRIEPCDRFEFFRASPQRDNSGSTHSKGDQYTGGADHA
jgi:hypothetical protein